MSAADFTGSIFFVSAPLDLVPAFPGHYLFIHANEKLKGDPRIVVHLLFLSPFAVHDLTRAVHAGDLPGFLYRLFFLFKTMDHRLVMVQNMPLVAFLIPLDTVYPFSDDVFSSS